MSNILDIDALPDEPAAQGAKEAPRKWQKHSVAIWYFALQDAKTAILKVIESDPDGVTEEDCRISKTDIAQKMGKNKSHLSPSQWIKKDTPTKKAKAFIVEEIDKIDDSLRLARNSALERTTGNSKSTTRSMAALLRDIEDHKKSFERAAQQTWSDLLQQLDNNGEELQSKCDDLQNDLEKARKSIRNQRNVHQKKLSERSLDHAEIDRLTQLNAALKTDLRKAQENLDQLSSEASNSKGKLIRLVEGKVDVSYPPEGINSVAWNEWVAYRAKIRKKVSPAAARKQWEILRHLSFEEQAHTINESIANDYQGLFPAKSSSRHRGTSTRSRSLEQDLNDTSWTK